MRQKPGSKQSHGEKVVKDIRRATRKKPEERYADASQMWEGFYDAMRQMKIIPAPAAIEKESTEPPVPSIPLIVS